VLARGDLAAVIVLKRNALYNWPCCCHSGIARRQALGLALFRNEVTVALFLDGLRRAPDGGVDDARKKRLSSVCACSFAAVIVLQGKRSSRFVVRPPPGN
jgi:hypothetical protein